MAPRNTFNQELADELVAERAAKAILEERTARDIARHYKRMIPQLSAKLAAEGKEYERRRLAKLIGDMAKIVQGVESERAFGKLDTVIGDIASTESGKMLDVFRDATPAGLELSMQQLSSADVAAAWKPPHYAKLAKRMSAVQLIGIQDSIARSMSAGESIRQASKRMTKTVTSVTRSRARTIARTEIGRASTTVQLAHMDKNKGFLRGVQFASTLDERTCLVCGPLDGQTWPQAASVPNESRPPVHPNCRCVLVPVAKGLDDIFPQLKGLTSTKVKGWRASMDGQVPKDMTYASWFKRQGEARQRAILGPHRFELWKAGKIGVGDFSPGGKVSSLGKLRGIKKPSTGILKPIKQTGPLTKPPKFPDGVTVPGHKPKPKPKPKPAPKKKTTPAKKKKTTPAKKKPAPAAKPAPAKKPKRKRAPRKKKHPSGAPDEVVFLTPNAKPKPFEVVKKSKRAKPLKPNAWGDAVMSRKTNDVVPFRRRKLKRGLRNGEDVMADAQEYLNAKLAQSRDVTFDKKLSSMSNAAGYAKPGGKTWYNSTTRRAIKNVDDLLNPALNSTPAAEVFNMADGDLIANSLNGGYSTIFHETAHQHGPIWRSKGFYDAADRADRLGIAIEEGLTETLGRHGVDDFLEGKYGEAWMGSRARVKFAEQRLNRGARSSYYEWTEGIRETIHQTARGALGRAPTSGEIVNMAANWKDNPAVRAIELRHNRASVDYIKATDALRALDREYLTYAGMPREGKPLSEFLIKRADLNDIVEKAQKIKDATMSDHLTAHVTYGVDSIVRHNAKRLLLDGAEAGKLHKRLRDALSQLGSAQAHSWETPDGRNRPTSVSQLIKSIIRDAEHDAAARIDAAALKAKNAALKKRAPRKRKPKVEQWGDSANLLPIAAIEVPFYAT